MKLQYYYFVHDTEKNECLGMNLTEDEMKKIFYREFSDGMYRNSQGHSYGCTDFKIQSHSDYQLLHKLREHFKCDSDNYSYVVMTSNNEWVSTGVNEAEEEMLETVKSCMRHDVGINVFEVVANGLML